MLGFEGKKMNKNTRFCAVKCPCRLDWRAYSQL